MSIKLNEWMKIERLRTNNKNNVEREREMGGGERKNEADEEKEKKPSHN